MEKVTDKWFKDHGFEEYVETRGDSKHVIYSVRDGKRTARFDHHYNVMEDRVGLHKSNWYSFFCSGNGFSIENRISFRKFSVNQIESALKVVGIL